MSKQHSFRPTYLYINQHKITGLKYFGKTCKPILNGGRKYFGSGKYWTRHIKEHGTKYVETIWAMLFVEEEELVKFALMCSHMWNIVESDEWANLIPENGLWGGDQNGIKRSEETRAKMRKPKSEKAKENMKGPKTKEHLRNFSISRSRKYILSYPDINGKVDIHKTRQEIIPHLKDFIKEHPEYKLNYKSLICIANGLAGRKQCNGFVIEHYNA